MDLGLAYGYRSRPSPGRRGNEDLSSGQRIIHDRWASPSGTHKLHTHTHPQNHLGKGRVVIIIFISDVATEFQNLQSVHYFRMPRVRG